jgi:hypothetical protein
MLLLVLLLFQLLLPPVLFQFTLHVLALFLHMKLMLLLFV